MTNIFHKIRVYLYENFLTPKPNDYMARVSSERSLGVNEVCVSAANRGGANITPEAMEHSVLLFLKEMAYQMCDGYSINTGYFTAGTLVKGVFDSPTEKFDPKKHSIVFQFNQGELLRNEIPTIEVEVMGIAEVGCFIGEVTDVKTGTTNELLTPGRNLKISGSKLKLAGENPDNGVYFINQTSGESIKVDTSDIVTNNPSELMIVIPQLAAGSYKLEVKTQFAVGSILKEPRNTIFDKTLTVV